MDRNTLRLAQAALNTAGFGPLVEDGLMGRKTMAAVQAFQQSKGLFPDGVIGQRTHLALFGPALAPATKKVPALPWIDGARAQIGLHEIRDNAFLREFLKSDGKTVGDPSKISWCGDYVDTWMKLTLPNEPKWPENPYAAISWASWAEYVKPQYGCVMSFHRGDPTNWQGHVAWYVSEDAHNYHVLGANQSNSINIAKIPRDRLRKNGSRWPVTGPRPTGQVIVGDGSRVLNIGSVT